jgi:hypothetical protein
MFDQTLAVSVVAFIAIEFRTSSYLLELVEHLRVVITPSYESKYTSFEVFWPNADVSSRSLILWTFVARKLYCPLAMDGASSRKTRITRFKSKFTSVMLEEIFIGKCLLLKFAGHWYENF